MRTLVTGASGFCGSVMARALARAGFAVVGVYRRDTAFLESLRRKPRIDLVRADLSEAARLPGPFESIVHVATTSPGPAISVDRLVQDNIVGTFALINAGLAWGSRRFVFFSSLSVYGDIQQPLVDESTPIRNPDVYGTTKLLSESRLLEVTDRLPALVLRLPGVVGPGAHRNWLSSVAAQLRRNEVIRAFHLDRPFNNSAHVADVAAFVATVLRRDWEGFDAVVLGSRGMTTVRGAVTQLAKGLAAPVRLEAVAPAKASFTLSCQRAIADWGYDPMDIHGVLDRYARDIIDREGQTA